MHAYYALPKDTLVHTSGPKCSGLGSLVPGDSAQWGCSAGPLWFQGPSRVHGGRWLPGRSRIHTTTPQTRNGPRSESKLHITEKHSDTLSQL